MFSAQCLWSAHVTTEAEFKEKLEADGLDVMADGSALTGIKFVTHCTAGNTPYPWDGALGLLLCCRIWALPTVTMEVASTIFELPWFQSKAIRISRCDQT
jgi:hypothetical protein